MGIYDTLRTGHAFRAHAVRLPHMSHSLEKKERDERNTYLGDT